MPASASLCAHAATPRRIAIAVAHVRLQQRQELTVAGPVKVAFDADAIRPAAIGFARANGVESRNSPP
jgi:glycyl-tRNA synthetase beta subunit